jgi:hypothetical protein
MGASMAISPNPLAEREGVSSQAASQNADVHHPSWARLRCGDESDKTPGRYLRRDFRASHNMPRAWEG